MKLIENPILIKKALSFYKSHSAVMDNYDIEDLCKKFNTEIKTDLSYEEFDIVLESMGTATRLASQLKKGIDYIVTNENTIRLLDKKTQRVMDACFTNGVHEFLEEILRSEDRLGPKRDKTDFLTQYKTLNVGFSGTVEDKGFRP